MVVLCPHEGLLPVVCGDGPSTASLCFSSDFACSQNRMTDHRDCSGLSSFRVGPAVVASASASFKISIAVGSVEWATSKCSLIDVSLELPESRES